MRWLIMKTDKKNRSWPREADNAYGKYVVGHWITVSWKRNRIDRKIISIIKKTNLNRNENNY